MCFMYRHTRMVWWGGGGAGGASGLHGGAPAPQQAVSESNIVHRVSIVVRADFVSKLNVFVEAVLDECDCVVDAHRLREFAVRLEVSRLVRSVLENDVSLRVLVVTQTDENDVTLVDPHLTNNKKKCF